MNVCHSHVVKLGHVYVYVSAQNEHVYFICLQCDQQKEGIVNTPVKMDEYCREKGFAGWFETSAKENINIEEAARSLVNKVTFILNHLLPAKICLSRVKL